MRVGEEVPRLLPERFLRVRACRARCRSGVARRVGTRVARRSRAVPGCGCLDSEGGDAAACAALTHVVGTAALVQPGVGRSLVPGRLGGGRGGAEQPEVAAKVDGAAAVVERGAVESVRGVCSRDQGSKFGQVRKSVRQNAAKTPAAKQEGKCGSSRKRAARTRSQCARLGGQPETMLSAPRLHAG